MNFIEYYFGQTFSETLCSSERNYQEQFLSQNTENKKTSFEDIQKRLEVLEGPYLEYLRAISKEIK